MRKAGRSAASSTCWRAACSSSSIVPGPIRNRSPMPIGRMTTGFQAISDYCQARAKVRETTRRFPTMRGFIMPGCSRRSAAVVEDLLTDLLGQPSRVIEYCPRWRDLEDGDRTRLARGDFAVLGGGAMLGGRTRIADDTFRIVISTNSAADHATLLPTGQRL